VDAQPGWHQLLLSASNPFTKNMVELQSYRTNYMASTAHF